MTIRRFTLVILTGMLATWSGLAAEGWMTDWSKARETAARDGRTILVDFSGSDWCGWCIRLDEEVLATDIFKKFAAENLVLMQADFPRHIEQSAPLKEQNRNLQKQFGVEGYPTLILTDPQGRPFAVTGYRTGGPAAYLDHLRELMQIRTQLDQTLAKAGKAAGVERAKILVEALARLPLTMLKFYDGPMQEIRELDKENQTGFTNRFYEVELLGLQETVHNLSLADGKTREALGKVDDFIASRHITGEMKQKVLMVKMKAYPPRTQANIDHALAIADEISELGAETETAKQCQAVKAWLNHISKLIADVEKK